MSHVTGSRGSQSVMRRGTMLQSAASHPQAVMHVAIWPPEPVTLRMKVAGRTYDIKPERARVEGPVYRGTGALGLSKRSGASQLNAIADLPDVASVALSVSKVTSPSVAMTPNYIAHPWAELLMRGRARLPLVVGARASYTIIE